VIRGRVIGEVWATRRAPSLGENRLKVVAVEGVDGATPAGRIVVATDTLDAPTGGEVLVTFGSGARNVLRPGGNENRFLLCDCAVNLIIDADITERDARGSRER
jgi:microcompartment protein CcmK/EutM